MIKHGLDSSVLINLIVCYDSEFQAFERRGYSHEEDVFYFHDVSIPEVFRVLMNKFNFTKQEVRYSIAKLIKQFKLKRIYCVEEIDGKYEDLVEEANKRIIKTDFKLRIGENDIIILGGFLRNKINVVHSSDKAFLKTCEELNIQISPIPEEDLEKEKQLFRFMKKRFS